MFYEIKSFSLLLIPVLLLAACSNDRTEYDNIEERIDYLIEDDRYEDALEALEDEDRNDPEIRTLLEKTHLNYGLHNMNTFDETEMRTRMNDALRQFTEVLKINENNDMARNQINQILQIYDTIPDRQPEEDVLEGLREVGYEI